MLIGDVQKAIESLSAQDRGALLEKLTNANMADIHAGAEKKRVDIMAAAAKNPDLKPTITYVVGQLRSLGIDIHGAADLATLNKALSDAKWPMTQRLGLKTGLARLGVLA